MLFVLMDYIYNFESLPKASNLQVLYIFYMFIYAFFIIYHLGIVFGFLLTLSSMIKFNEIVSFYSLGFSPKKLIKPFLFLSILVFFFISFLQTTKISYANQYAAAIKSGNRLKNKNLFLKFENKIIYIKELNPILKKAYGMDVFEIENQNVKKVVFADEAVFKNNNWFVINGKVLYLKNKQWIKKEENLTILKNFKPKILSNLKMLNNISFYDAYITIKYFKDIDLNKILSIVFFKIFTPLSMIAFMVFLFLTSPIHIRISNVAFFMVKSVTFTLFLWGSELMLFKFAKQGILPYWVLSIPFILILIIDIVILRRSNEF